VAQANRNLPQIGCVMLLTAAVAFPAGLWVAGTGREDATTSQVPAPRRSGSPVRNPYSATIRNDPFVLDRQRELVEALERACRQPGTQCPEARGARRYLDRHAAEP